MERKLIRGDYVPDGRGGLIGLDGGRRGSFPFLPELGSRLYQLGREKPSERPALAAQYVAEALREETDLAVRSVELRQDGAAGRLTVYLDWQGEMLTARVTLPVL